MELYAAPWLTWSRTTYSVTPVGVGPAVAHFEAQLPELILNEMRLEGIDLSKPQLDRILTDDRQLGGLVSAVSSPCAQSTNPPTPSRPERKA